MTRAAFVCALIVCGAVGCRYDYDALKGTGAGPGSGGAGANPGMAGALEVGGRGGGSGGRASGEGGSFGARGGTGGEGNTGGGAGGTAGGGDRGGAGGAGGAVGRGGASGDAGRGGGGEAGSTGGGGTVGGGGASGGAGADGRGGSGGASGGTGGGPAGDVVLWYRFDDASGTVAADSSTGAGAPHNGMLMTAGTGTGTFSTTHQVGTGALTLNGSSSTNGAYVNVPASLNALGATTAITIACWINVTTDRAWGRVFDFNNTSTTGYMFLTTYQSQKTPNSVRFAISAAGNSTEEQIGSTGRLSTGAWHHVAVVLDAGATYTGTLYVDGVVAGTNAAMTLRPSSLGNTANNWIGRSAYTTDPYFAGLLDDFRVYNRALSASEITTLFATVR